MMGKTPQKIGESQYIHSGTCRRLQAHSGACRHTSRQSTRSVFGDTWGVMWEGIRFGSHYGVGGVRSVLR